MQNPSSFLLPPSPFSAPQERLSTRGNELFVFPLCIPLPSPPPKKSSKGVLKGRRREREAKRKDEEETSSKREATYTKGTACKTVMAPPSLAQKQPELRPTSTNEAQQKAGPSQRVWVQQASCRKQRRLGVAFEYATSVFSAVVSSYLTYVGYLHKSVN